MAADAELIYDYEYLFTEEEWWEMQMFEKSDKFRDDYLDGGMEIPKGIITRLILGKEPTVSGNQDYKTRFQELVQRTRDQVISYALTGESGPDHHKTFTVEVSLNGAPVGTGSGSSKKRAEQDAAREAIARLFPGE